LRPWQHNQAAADKRALSGHLPQTASNFLQNHGQNKPEPGEKHNNHRNLPAFLEMPCSAPLLVAAQNSGTANIAANSLKMPPVSKLACDVHVRGQPLAAVHVRVRLVFRIINP
jgi:hypothetical protein